MICLFNLIFAKGDGDSGDKEFEWDHVEDQRGMSNLMGMFADQLVKAFDLSCHKSAVDLGGL